MNLRQSTAYSAKIITVQRTCVVFCYATHKHSVERAVLQSVGPSACLFLCPSHWWLELSSNLSVEPKDCSFLALSRA